MWSTHWYGLSIVILQLLQIDVTMRNAYHMNIFMIYTMSCTRTLLLVLSIKKGFFSTWVCEQIQTPAENELFLDAKLHNKINEWYMYMYEILVMTYYTDPPPPWPYLFVYLHVHMNKLNPKDCLFNMLMERLFLSCLNAKKSRNSFDVG